MSCSEVMRDESEVSRLVVFARRSHTLTFIGRETLRFVVREREEHLEHWGFTTSSEDPAWPHHLPPLIPVARAGVS